MGRHYRYRFACLHGRLRRDRVLNTRLRRGDSLTLLDVRPGVQVAQDPCNLPGAVHIPAPEIQERHRELPPDREIVVYCS